MCPSSPRLWQGNEVANWHCKKYLPGPGSREARNGGTELPQTAATSFLERVIAELTPYPVKVSFCFSFAFFLYLSFSALSRQKIVFPMHVDKLDISFARKVIGMVTIDSPLLWKKHQGFLASDEILCSYS